MKVYICSMNSVFTYQERHRAIYKSLLREIKKEYGYDCGLSNIDYQNGKPVLKGVPIYFSISHAENISVFAISNSKIGIDAEKIKKPDEDILNKVYTESERQYVYSSIDPSISFYRVWTYKEAFVKYLGCGIDRRFFYMNTIINGSFVDPGRSSFLLYNGCIITTYGDSKLEDIHLISTI